MRRNEIENNIFERNVIMAEILFSLFVDGSMNEIPVITQQNYVCIVNFRRIQTFRFTRAISKQGGGPARKISSGQLWNLR